MERGREGKNEGRKRCRELGIDNKHHTITGYEVKKKKVEIIELAFGSWSHMSRFGVCFKALGALLCGLSVLIDAKTSWWFTIYFVCSSDVDQIPSFSSQENSTGSRGTELSFYTSQVPLSICIYNLEKLCVIFFPGKYGVFS